MLWDQALVGGNTQIVARINGLPGGKAIEDDLTANNTLASKTRLTAALVAAHVRPALIPVIIFSGVPSESGQLERFRPRTRLIEKPYSLVQLVATLNEMLADGSEDLHS